MSYKFDSLITILNKLDKGEQLTVHSLMNDLEMSERTVHRYINTLQVAGFPISYDRSRQTYAFDEGYGLKKLTMSVEETLAFGLADIEILKLFPIVICVNLRLYCVK